MTVITINPTQMQALAGLMRQTAGEYDTAALGIHAVDTAACPADLATVAGEICTLLGGALVALANDLTTDAATLDARASEAIAADTGGGSCCGPAGLGMASIAGTIMVNVADGDGGFLDPQTVSPATLSPAASVTVRAAPTTMTTAEPVFDGGESDYGDQAGGNVENPVTLAFEDAVHDNLDSTAAGVDGDGSSYSVSGSMETVDSESIADA